MISTPLIVAVVVLAVGRVEKSTALFHAFHRPVFHSPEFTIPKPELTLGIDLKIFSCFIYLRPHLIRNSACGQQGLGNENLKFLMIDSRTGFD